MFNRIHRTAVGISAVAALSFGMIVTATANHGPNCDQPREDVVAFLEDNMDEWNVYDNDDDGVACETTHELTKDDITGGGGGPEDEGDNGDDSVEDDENNGGGGPEDEGDNGDGSVEDDDDNGDEGPEDDDGAADDESDDEDVTVPTEIDTGR